MSLAKGTLWHCDVKDCEHTAFQENLEDIPDGWRIHDVDGQTIICCPEHNKAFVGMINCFVRNVSLDMQCLINSYESTFIQ